MGALPRISEYLEMHLDYDGAKKMLPITPGKIFQVVIIFSILQSNKNRQRSW